ncbi:pectinesterase family protein [Paenibacillus alkaliterrae]|uniref:pectinesterase family protein n=1 Tax=Paenibacillus alkaliterrae TaxID=320909 RepID=UPI001F24B31A|nr:pectinesterase family protein [Paenibacillus alkaliterrae]MCF2938182.1 pectinesterase family protein [Paenibacillus alkaliterrae]
MLLGRPWRNYAKTAFIRCWMGGHIHPDGWDNWNKPEAEATANYCEYGSTGPGAGTEGRVPWAKRLSGSEAAMYTPAKVLAGEDGWNPFE